MRSPGKGGGGLSGVHISQISFQNIEPPYYLRVEPYSIPEVPSSSSNYSAAEVEAIKHQRVREQNKLASQKCRFSHIDLLVCR